MRTPDRMPHTNIGAIGQVADAVTKAITIDGRLRTELVQAIMAEWDKNRPTQNSSMCIQAANACVNVLLRRS
jgi:hypothetical protein